MNQAEFNKVVEETVESIKQLLLVKGEEYAGSADRLANFKRGAANVGITPLQTALIYASKHYDSINTFVRNGATGKTQILSEPIEGRLDDLINYCILIKALIKEGSGDTQTLSPGQWAPFKEGLLTKVYVDKSL